MNAWFALCVKLRWLHFILQAEWNQEEWREEDEFRNFVRGMMNN